MLFLSDIIALFQPVTYREILVILSSLFGNNIYDIKMEIGLLSVLDLVKEYNGYLVSTAEDQQLFFSFESINETKLRATILNHYHKYNKARAGILRHKVGIES
jgi:hypothetical protein